MLSVNTEAALFVDASNAFNSLNRQVMLHNIQCLCPSLASISINCYRSDVPLYIDGETLFSQEGTTQGDPLAMPLYALDVVPLISKLYCFSVHQISLLLRKADHILILLLVPPVLSVNLL